jgi:hypothetical protein
MKNSIKQELASHIIDRINDGVIYNENKEGWHFYCFNEDYYIIGYYQASEWLKAHDLDAFEAVSICQEYERDNFGKDAIQIYDNSEKTVNMLAYIYGEELLNSVDVDTVEELKEEMEGLL